MTKKLTIIAFVSLLFVLTLFLLIVNITRKGTKPDPSGAVSPTQVPLISIVPLEKLIINSTIPVDGAVEIELDSKIVVNFNRQLTAREIVVEFFDSSLKKTRHQLEINKSTLIIKPQEKLSQSMVYTVRIRNQQLEILAEFDFLTSTVSPSVDTRPVAALTKTIERTKKERPDIYLANLMPYQSFDFEMELEIDNQGYFTFLVNSNRLSGTLLKDRVEQWLLSLELTTDQIKKLPIKYR